MRQVSSSTISALAASAVREVATHRFLARQTAPPALLANTAFWTDSLRKALLARTAPPAVTAQTKASRASLDAETVALVPSRKLAPPAAATAVPVDTRNYPARVSARIAMPADILRTPQPQAPCSACPAQRGQLLHQDPHNAAFAPAAGIHLPMVRPNVVAAPL